MVSGVCLTALCLTREGVAQWTCLHELRREGVSTCLIPELVMGILLRGGVGGEGRRSSSFAMLCKPSQASVRRQRAGMSAAGSQWAWRRCRQGDRGSGGGQGRVVLASSSAVPVHNGSRKPRRPSDAALGRNGQLHSPSLAGPLPRFAAPHFVLFSACSLALARLELMMHGI